MTRHIGAAAGICVLAAAAGASATTVTIDMNGFPNRTGGQVTGPGLDKPIPMKAGEEKVVLENLQPGQTYGVDFFHNSGPLSSDFSITINAAGSGVGKLKGWGEKPTVVVLNFKPGDATLKLNTHKIVYNPDAIPLPGYYVGGLVEAHTIPAGAGPQTFVAIPGMYNVDNLHNSNETDEDYPFVVTADGRVEAAPAVEAVRPSDANPLGSRGKPRSDEYAKFTRNEVQPRAARVHLKIETSGPVNFHFLQPAGAVVAKGTTYEVDTVIPVGGGGINIWTFGRNSVTESDAMLGEHRPLKGTQRDNDFMFAPRLRYDKNRDAFYFVTASGPAQRVSAEASGTADDGTTMLTAKVLATIEPGPATTQPATKPAATDATAPMK